MSDERKDIAPPNRRRWAFSLRATLLSVAAFAILLAMTNWGWRLYLAQRACSRYRRAKENYQVGFATALDICIASEEWCAAEYRVPFANRWALADYHCDRMDWIERDVTAHLELSVWGSREGAREYAEDVGKVVEGYSTRAREEFYRQNGAFMEPDGN